MNNTAYSTSAELTSPVARARTSPRIPGFDFTKGVLVLFMVLYHWLNYFVTAQGDIYDYLRFLTPSFIFITGFLISYVLFGKYGIGNPQLARRLLFRGVKLLGIFIALNILIDVMFRGTAVGSLYLLTNVSAIFLTGNVVVSGIGKTAAFMVLVPISYLLIGSAVLLMIHRSVKYVFEIVAAVLLVASFALDVYGTQLPNVELLGIGLLGVILGRLGAGWVTRLNKHTLALIIAYCGYLAFITLWHVPFLLRVTGVCLTLMLIYVVSNWGDTTRGFYHHILVLGQYSLFGYIIQIAILQVLHRALWDAEIGSVAFWFSFIAGFGLTMISVEAVHRARPRWAAVDQAYRLIFA